MLVPAIEESCRIKADVVSKDERESGLRRILNYGHTVGHALEAVTKYRRFRHGEAIAFGMLAAADLAVARGALAERARQALADLIAALGPLPSLADISITDVLEVRSPRQESGERTSALRHCHRDRRDDDDRRRDRG